MEIFNQDYKNTVWNLHVGNTMYNLCMYFGTHQILFSNLCTCIGETSISWKKIQKYANETQVSSLFQKLVIYHCKDVHYLHVSREYKLFFKKQYLHVMHAFLSSNQ